MDTSTASKATDGLGGSAADSLPDLLDQCLTSGVVVVSADRKISAITDEARDLLGLRDGPIDFATLPPLLREMIQGAFERGTAAAFGASFQSEAPDGDENARTVKVTCTPIPGPKGKPANLVVVVNDTTAARRLEQNLRQMDRLASIGTLSASMAHEVKNALVAIKTFVDLLVNQNQNAQLAEIVGREMKRIDSIVSQMLRFGGPARPRLGVIPINQILEQSLNLVRHHLEGRKIVLESHLDAAPDTVQGDGYQLEQAVINLLFNALDAMGANGLLQVRTELKNPSRLAGSITPSIEITIQDNGMGIPPENLARLFEPFFTTKPNGTGLGLPITRRIVEEHRGTITVTSKLNGGTCFVIALPSFTGRQP